jgi:hypothetical protein
VNSDEERLERRIEHAFQSLPGAEHLPGIVIEIIRAAAVYWRGIDPADFCIQSFSPTSIVFGSTNRLVWTPTGGFRPDRSYCTNKFLGNCAALGYLPGGA